MAKGKSRGPRGRGEPQAPPPSRDWPVAGVAAAGLLVALYLTYTKLAQGTALFCESGGGCDIVQASRYASFLGVPTALWGAALYAAVGTLALLGLPEKRWLWAFLLTVSAVGFSAYLTWLSATELRALCGWCLASGAAALALFALLLYRRPPAVGARSPLRPRRLAAYAVLMGVGTVVFGAGVYAGSSTSPEAVYRDGLARHLAQTGAIMYGAYW
jgi:uncharacterized membrane protein